VTTPPFSDSNPSPNQPDSDDSFPDARERSLDILLGKVRAPGLSQGFTDGVIHSVQPQRSVFSKRAVAALTSVAALVALSFASQLFVPTVPEQDLQSLQLPLTASIEEQRLVDTLREALRSPGLVSDDLPVVAKLGEILEAELSANQPLWTFDN
jgi:hypothetical protein